MIKTLEIIQWIWILLIGLFTSIVPDYTAGFQKVIWTVISMALGTVVSYYVKRFLNRRKRK